MHYKLAVLISMGLSATQTIAYSHGEQGEFNGKAIKWQQLAEGVFTGVPAEEWDNKVHKRQAQVLDIEEIMSATHNASALSGRDLDLEARSIPETCQAIINCAKELPDAILSVAFSTYFQTAAYLSTNAAKDLMEFLNQPFVANAAGVAVAGVISGQINEATKKECSSSGSEQDALNSAVQAALQNNPKASSVSVTVNGPSGSWTIDVTVKPEGQNPVPRCFDA